MKKITGPDWVFIMVLLLFAAGLRIIGISYGQPDPQYARSTYPRQMLHYQTPMQPDEYEFVAIPFQMVVQKTLTPGYVNRGLATTLNMVVSWITGAGNGLTYEADRQNVNSREYAPFTLYVVGRVFSALGGLMAVAAGYGIARQISGRFAAAMTGAVIAVSLTMVQHAHYATPSSMSSGFTMVAIWASFNCLRSSKRSARFFALASVAGGLASASRYNAAGVLIVVGLVGLILIYRSRSWKTVWMVGLLALLAPAAFAITTPQLILTPREFWDHFMYAVNQYAGSGISVMFPISKAYGLVLEYRYMLLFSLGIPAGLFALIGIFAAWRTSPRGKKHWLNHNSPALFVSILLINLLAYSYVVLQTVRPDGADQLLIPAIPQCAVLAGIGAGWVYSTLWLSPRLLAPGLTFILIVVPLVSSVQFVRQLTQPDTRELMQAWVYQHIPKGSKIYLSGPYNVPLDSADYVTTQGFSGNTQLFSEIQNAGSEYVILSDSWHHTIQRSWEVYPASYVQEDQEHFDAIADRLVEVARIDRPIWTGYDWMGHTPSQWHNPGLIAYCTSEESCANVR